MSYGHEQSERFEKDVKILEDECKGAGLGDQYSRVMEILLQKSNSDTPQEYPVKAPPPEKSQVGQFPTKAPPPMPAASVAGAPSKMTQRLTHANYPIPTWRGSDKK